MAVDALEEVPEEDLAAHDLCTVHDAAVLEGAGEDLVPVRLLSKIGDIQILYTDIYIYYIILYYIILYRARCFLPSNSSNMSS